MPVGGTLCVAIMGVSPLLFYSVQTTGIAITLVIHGYREVSASMHVIAAQSAPPTNSVWFEQKKAWHLARLFMVCTLLPGLESILKPDSNQGCRGVFELITWSNAC